eukprot:TRINITY_DN19049_c0_g4_i1.p1 TRINITY_DN19049_c0_g4~~TRINITY_DN19049_c0_g4_i1.p1  ORF type:complete len:357 (-),score=60.20 TRINITY_DN19049_c0_g4_i1:8-1078(-)
MAAGDVRFALRQSKPLQAMHMHRAPLVAWTCVLLGFQVQLGAAQKGIGSLNDPCDCMQHHDYWMATRTQLRTILEAPDFAARIHNPEDKLHHWIKVQSCMYSPENEEAHRPTALSDCIPGFLYVHIVCMQRQIVDRNPDKILSYANELARLYPWGANCMDRSGWPIKAREVMQYYRRVRRAYAAHVPGTPISETLLKEMTWGAHPAELSSGDGAEEDVSMHERPDVCPVGTLPSRGACWLLGEVGASCRQACERANLAFRKPLPGDGEVLLPYVLVFGDGTPVDDLLQQHPWAPFECYVPSELRMHKADPQAAVGEGDWSYPICALVCPCGPQLGKYMVDVLTSVPVFPPKFYAIG